VDPASWYISYRKTQQGATVYQTFIFPYLYEAQHVSGDTPPIIKNLKLHKQLLVLHTWKIVGREVVGLQSPTPARPTTFHVCKTRGC
jgi:hypothetical protein